MDMFQYIFITDKPQYKLLYLKVRKTTSCSIIQERDLSLLKDTSKRLLCSITTERDFYSQGQLQETSFAQSQLKETSKQLQRIEYSLNT